MSHTQNNGAPSHPEGGLVEIGNAQGETKILDRTSAGDWVRVHGWKFLRTSGVVKPAE